MTRPEHRTYVHGFVLCRRPGRIRGYYVCIDRGRISLTEDDEKALRFARKIDATKFAIFCDRVQAVGGEQGKLEPIFMSWPVED